MEAAEMASRWLWIRRSDPWVNAPRTLARVCSALAGLPEPEYEEPKHLVTSGNITDDVFEHILDVSFNC